MKQECLAHRDIGVIGFIKYFPYQLRCGVGESIISFTHLGSNEMGGDLDLMWCKNVNCNSEIYI